MYRWRSLSNVRSFVTSHSIKVPGFPKILSILQSLNYPYRTFSSKSLLSLSHINPSKYPYSSRYLLVNNYQPRLHRYFSQSAPRHVLVVPTIAIRVVGIPGAILVGRYVRKQWNAIPLHTKQKFYEEHKIHIAGGGLAIVLFSLLYYLLHLDKAPITGRRRFMIFNVDQFESIVEMEKAMLFRLMKANFVSTTHPAYKQVNRVVSRILKSNSDVDAIREKSWKVTVIDSTKQNAFVVPTGHIFVFTGILDILTSDDHLAVVLSHELAHTILDHVPELHSTQHVSELLALLGVSALWATLTSWIWALAASVVIYEFLNLFVYLPHHRLLEHEADEVGVELMAKACYDVRENVAFWRRMHLMHNMTKPPESGPGGVVVPEFFSTHPAHVNRAEKLQKHVPKAMETRDSCNCSPLPAKDPSSDVEKLRVALINAKTLEDPWGPFTTDL